MKYGKNGWINAVVPALALTLPVGSVYAFSCVAEQLAIAFSTSINHVQWAFSLSIFFLGLGAAFFGSMVEKNPRKAAVLATCLFASGTALTGYSVFVGDIWLAILGYGVLNGLGQGIAYLTPVKNLMLWFPKSKALAASVSITAFGLGSALFAWLADKLSHSMPLECFFYTIALAYGSVMALGAIVIAKPKIAQIAESVDVQSFSLLQAMRSRFFWHAWMFMFLSIAPGLALIGCAAGIFQDAGYASSATVQLLVACGIANGSFRIVAAWLSDMAKPRAAAWVWLACVSVAAAVLAGVDFSLAGLSVVAVNACYGGAFATCPAMVSDYVDPRCVSRMHGLVLTAWAAAGLIGNKLAMHIYSMTGSFHWVFWFIAAAYALNVLNAWALSRWHAPSKTGLTGEA